MATEETETTVDDETWDRFISRVEDIRNIQFSEWMLYWDQELMMPEEGGRARRDQLSTLSSVRLDFESDDEMGELIEAVKELDLTSEQEAIVRKAENDHESAKRMSRDVVAKLSGARTTAHKKWEQAKKEDDYSIFAPEFERMIELRREQAHSLDLDDDPYAVLFYKYDDPHIDFEKVEQIFDRLYEELIPLIEAVRESDADLRTNAFSGTFDVETQEQLSRDLLDTVGYDWKRGRLDQTPYSLTAGAPCFDTRIGISFDESDLLGAITSTLHQFGLAKYMQALPDEHYGTPLGEALEIVVHTAQAQFWEHRIGRSKEFWEYFLPTVEERFPQLEDVSPQAAYETVNHVREDNLIWEKASELTGPLHILVRFEIERDLMHGDLDIEDVPEVWNEKYEEYLGVRPDSDVEGCLQSGHWAQGSFAYFISYTMGSVIAAQLYAAAKDQIGDPAALARDGNFEEVNEWLRENVYQHGKRYPTPELMKEVTGEEITADYYLDYVTDKYGELYDLDGY